MGNRYFPSRHLDSPVIDVNLKRSLKVLRHYGNNSLINATEPELLSMLPLDLSDHDLKVYKSITSTLVAARDSLGVNLTSILPLYPEDYASLWSTVTVPITRAKEVLDYALAAVDPLVAAASQAMDDLAGGSTLPTSLIGIADSISPTLAREEAWAYHIEAYVRARNEGKNDPVVSKAQWSSLVISQAICVLSLPDSLGYHSIGETTSYLLTYDQLVMLRDALMMRKNALLAARVIYPDDPLLLELMAKSFQWQEQVLCELGNEGYEVAKGVEALAKTYMSRVAGDVLAGPDDDFAEMVLKFHAKELKIRRKTSCPMPRLESLAELFYSNVLSLTTSVQQVSELFGLQKFCGHPLIDPYVSGLRSATIAREKERVLPSHARDLVCTFKKLFVEGFIRRHGKWPHCSFSVPNTALEKLYILQVSSLQRQQFPKHEWQYVTFGKEFDFEVYDNYLDLIDDKAISLYLDEKNLQWDSGTPTSSRRLLVELLRRESFSLAEVHQRIEDNDIPLRWLICSLYPKEREFKLAARMFVMLVLEMRTFFAVHEANIATKILPYLPQITMTDNKLAVHRRFLNLTRPSTDPDTVRFFLELDLSAWNLRWRACTVNPIGECLNNLFGLIRTFTSAHEFFERACVMVRVAGCRPEGAELLFPPESDLCWTFHLGGFEGIIQKLWSIATVCMIERALEGLPIKYTLTDQGDNIVITVTAGRDFTLPLIEQIKLLRDDILRRCAQSAAEVNQELKPEESLSSTTVLTYSKVVYVNGVDYPTVCKFMSRVMPSSAIDFPSYSAYIQAIFSGAYAAAETCKRPLLCWVLALIQGSYYITRTAQYSGAYHHALVSFNHLRTPEGIRYQLLWPSELGGLPITGIYAFLYKGGGDPTSKSLASLKLLQRHCREARAIVGLSRTSELIDPNPQLGNLLQDPYSLPIRKPTSPDEAIARDTLEVVISVARNKEIKEVLTFASDTYAEALTDIIKSLKPFNPVVARDLLDCSALGSVDTIKRMFLKTRTLQTIAREYEDVDLVETMLLAGRNQIAFVGRMIPRFDSHTGLITSLYDYVQDLRSRWDVCGIRIEALTSYLPIDFPVQWNPTSPIPGIRAELRAASNDIEYTRGRVDPYLGTATQAKRSEHGYKIVGTGYAESAMKSLQSILSWGKGDQGLCALVDYLSRSRCGIDLSPYSALLSAVIGGDQGHRYEARIGERDAHIIGLTSVASYTVLSTNNAGYLSATTEDYPIMFQEYMLYLISLVHERWCGRGNPGLIIGIVEIGTAPLEHLPMDTLHLPVTPLPKEIPRGMRLVQSTGIQVIQTGGPLWSSPIRLHFKPPADLVFPALISELHRALGVQKRLIGLISGTSTPIQPRFGVQEVAGIGGKRLLDAMAIVIIESSLGIMNSSRYTGRFNAGVNSLVNRFGTALVDGMIPLLSHPSLSSDPLVISLGIGPSPAYGNPLDPRRRLLGELSSHAVKLLSHPASIYYRTPVVVFGSDTNEATYGGFIKLVRKKSLQALASGLITVNDAEFIVGSAIQRVARTGVATEAEKITNFSTFLQSYRYYLRGRVAVSVAAQTVAVKVATAHPDSQLFATACGAEEFVRHYRYSPRTVSPLPALQPSQQLILTQGQSVQCVTSKSRLDPSMFQRLEYSFNTSYGRPHAWGTGALRAWRPLSSLFEGLEVTIVGSGLGAAAASVALGGGKRIWGHDLRRDFPATVSLSEYRPPLVRILAPRADYVQTSATLSTTGDWFEPAVAAILCNMRSTESALIIDISSTEGGKVEAIWPAIRAGFPYMVCFRSTTTDYQHSRIVGCLERLCSQWTVFSIDSSAPLYERVYIFTLSKWSLPISFPPRDAISIRDIPPTALPITIKALVAYILAPLGGVTGRTPRQALLGGLALFSDLMSTSMIRPSYHEWSQALQAVVTCEWVLLYDRQAQLNLLNILDSIRTYRLVSHPSIVVQATNDLLWQLAKIGSRVAGVLDSRL